MCAFQNGKVSLTPARNYPKFGVGGEKFPDFFPSFFLLLLYFSFPPLHFGSFRESSTVYIFATHDDCIFVQQCTHVCEPTHVYNRANIGVQVFFCGPLIVVLERGWWVVQQGGGLGGIVSPGTKSLSFHGCCYTFCYGLNILKKFEADHEQF